MTDRSLRSRAATLPARALIALAQHLPYRMRLALGSALLRGAVALVPRLRSRVENNLRLIFPEMPVGERRRIRRAMADNFGRTFTEILSNPDFHGRGYWIPPEPGPGTEAILRAAREGSGAVLVTGHFGQWEAGRAWMKSSGIACAGVYRPLDEPELNAIYLENLEFGGTPIFPKSRRGVRGIVAHVARGGIVAILTDQFERRGAPLDFIGHPAPTALVPAELAFRSKLPLVPIYGIRQPDGLHVQVVVEPPIPHSTVPEMMQAVNDSLAAQVRAHPGQYYWLHRRWVKRFAAPR